MLAARAFKRIIMEIPLVLNCLHLFCDFGSFVPLLSPFVSRANKALS